MMSVGPPEELMANDGTEFDVNGRNGVDKNVNKDHTMCIGQRPDRVYASALGEQDKFLLP